jgi:hypothetical protein
MQNEYLMKSCTDPYNCWVDAIKHGCIDTEQKLTFNGFPNTFKEEWMLFRCNELSSSREKEDKTNVPFYSQTKKAWWKYVLSNGGGFKRYREAYGGTLLHVVCRHNDLEAAQMIIHRKAVNPYLRNRWGFTAYDCVGARNIEMQRLVHQYRMFKPTLQYAEWLGPYFVEKAYTLLLVNHRLQLFPKDILIYILGWIACLDLY